MSQIENAVTSSSKEKRSYRKGKPMSASERQLAAIARKRETHKEVKVFVKNPLKDWMITICENVRPCSGLRPRRFGNYLKLLPSLRDGPLARL